MKGHAKTYTSDLMWTSSLTVADSAMELTRASQQDRTLLSYRISASARDHHILKSVVDLL
jgi:hypothetical protein